MDSVLILSYYYSASNTIFWWLYHLPAIWQITGIYRSPEYSFHWSTFQDISGKLDFKNIGEVSYAEIRVSGDTSDEGASLISASGFTFNRGASFIRVETITQFTWTEVFSPLRYTSDLRHNRLPSHRTICLFCHSEFQTPYTICETILGQFPQAPCSSECWFDLFVKGGEDKYDYFYGKMMRRQQHFSQFTYDKDVINFSGGILNWGDSVSPIHHI